jgi:hypothetical protein
VGVGLGVGVAVGVGVGEGVAVGVGEGVAVGVGEGVAFLTAMPLFQTNFFPDLIQVYLIPDDVLVVPSVLHVVPGLTAASAIG